MVVAITIIHVLVSIGLILVVLLQTGKADMVAVFGGSSSTIFGSSGAGNFLTRLTTGMAIVFMITSLTLGYFSGRHSSTSVFDTRSESAPARQSQPAPGAAPQALPPPSVPAPAQQTPAPQPTPAPQK